MSGARPVLTMFAGINGTGKSTLYALQCSRYAADMGVRICPDEILVENDGDWQDNKDVYASGRIAHRKIDECIEQGLSFNWEFTIISNYVIRVLEKAKAAGYQIRLNFILIDDVEVSLRRIENRVKNGGHGVPESIVRTRFARQLYNMENALKLADMSVFFYNDTFLKAVGFATKEQQLKFFDTDTKVTRELLNKLQPFELMPEEIMPTEEKELPQ